VPTRAGIPRLEVTVQRGNVDPVPDPGHCREKWGPPRFPPKRGWPPRRFEP
jgi:hypothetical protein